MRRSFYERLKVSSFWVPLGDAPKRLIASICLNISLDSLEEMNFRSLLL